MTKEQHINILTLLSALAAWSFSEKHSLPDYLLDDLSNAVDLLTAEILK